MRVPKNTCVPSVFSELVSCDQKRLGRAVLITSWGDLFQEYCHFCEDPAVRQVVSFDDTDLRKIGIPEFRRKENKNRPNAGPDLKIFLPNTKPHMKRVCGK